MSRAFRALVLCAFASMPGALRAQIHMVEFTGGVFVPAVLTMAEGDTLRVVNRDGVPHTLTARNGSYDSGRLMDGDVTQLVLREVGLHDFRCALGRQSLQILVGEARGAVRRGSDPMVARGYTHRAPTGPLALGQATELVFHRAGR